MEQKKSPSYMRMAAEVMEDNVASHKGTPTSVHLKPGQTQRWTRPPTITNALTPLPWKLATGEALIWKNRLEKGKRGAELPAQFWELLCQTQIRESQVISAESVPQKWS